MLNQIPVLSATPFSSAAPPWASCCSPSFGIWPSAPGATTAERAHLRGTPAARRAGVMGGTFDPIHHGHLVAASEVQAWFDLDEVVFRESDRRAPGRSPTATSRRPGAPVSDDGGCDRSQPALHRQPRRHRPMADVHDRHAARPEDAAAQPQSSSSSPVPTHWPTSSRGVMRTNCSSSANFVGCTDRAARWTTRRWPRSRPTGSR